MNHMTKHYEYAYLTRQDMAEDVAKKLQDKLVALITAKNGTITDLPKSYKKRLAFNINKQDAAYVNSILFQMESAPIEEFKKETDIITEIMRGLIISYDPEKLKREIRREFIRDEAKTPETTVAAAGKPVIEAAKSEPVKSAEPKVEEKPEEKIEEKEEKAAEPVAETPKEKEEKKEEKEEKKEEEAKVAKPKRKTKIKAELRDIEQKLDEILK